MTRLYENRGYAWRMTLSTVVLLVVIVYGFFEIWYASRSGDQGLSTGSLFGLGFIAGGAWGFRTIIFPAFDMVVSIDEGPAEGGATVVLWRPFVSKEVSLKLADLTGWRHLAKTNKRAASTHFLLVQTPVQRRSVELELRPGIKVSEGLRRLAPQAIAEYEAAAGAKA